MTKYINDAPDAIISIDEETGLPILVGTDGYRPPIIPERHDHQHVIEPWMTQDDHVILECTICGDQW